MGKNCESRPTNWNITFLLFFLCGVMVGLMLVAFMNIAMRFLCTTDLKHVFYLTLGLCMYCRTASTEVFRQLNREMLHTGWGHMLMH